MKKKKFYKITEMAEILNIGTRGVYMRIYKKKIKPAKDGLYSAEDFEKIKNHNTRKPGRPAYSGGKTPKRWG